MSKCIAGGAELEPPVRAPHTVYVKTLYRIAGQDYCRHHIIRAATAAGVITEVKPGAGPVVVHAPRNAFHRVRPAPPVLTRCTPPPGTGPGDEVRRTPVLALTNAGRGKGQTDRRSGFTGKGEFDELHRTQPPATGTTFHLVALPIEVLPSADQLPQPQAQRSTGSQAEGRCAGRCRDQPVRRIRDRHDGRAPDIHRKQS